MPLISELLKYHIYNGSLSDINMTGLCRLCLRSVCNSNFIIIKNKNTCTKTVMDKLHACIPELSIDLVMESLMCQNCATKLNDFYSFKQSCIESEKLVRDFMKQINTTDPLNDLNENQFERHPVSTEIIKEEHDTSINTLDTELKYEDIKKEYINEHENVKEVCRNEREDKNKGYINEHEVVKEVYLNQHEQVSNEYMPNDTQLANKELKIKKENEEETANSRINFMTSDSPQINLAPSETPDDSNLKVHVTKIFQCKVCDRKFPYKSLLKNHFKTHIEEKINRKTRNNWTYCYCKLSKRSRIKKHTAGYTGDKPFKCETCDYRSPSKSHLKKHCRMHIGEKPFLCMFCPRRYSDRSLVKKHEAIHTGEKPFGCRYCDYKGSTESNLKTHYKIHMFRRTRA